MRRYPLTVGSLFGAIQTGYFLQLSFAFSSAAITLFGVTLAWLIGSGCGLWLTRRLKVGWWQIAPLSIGSYLLCSAILLMLPLQDGLLPVYLLMVALSGLYSGWFFATVAGYFQGKVERLFFWENNGFVAGIALTTVMYIFVGRLILWLFPVVLALITYPRTITKERLA